MADAIQIAAPDGAVVEFPAGTSDATIRDAMRRAYPPKAEPTGSVVNPLDDAVRAVANGATLGLADRFAAGMGALTGVGGTQGDYAGNLQREQARTDQYSAEHPIENLAARTAGTVAALPLGAGARAVEGAGLGLKTLYGAGVGGGVGAVQGAAGSRDFTDIPQTAEGAAIGAGTGAALGGAIPLGGKVVGDAYNAVLNAVRGGADGMSRGASRHLVDALRADTLPAVEAKMGQLGPDAMLTDAGPAFLGKGQGAALNSDDGRSIMVNALKGRNEGTNQRIISDVNSALGPAEDPQVVTNNIMAHRTAVDSKSYPAALDNAPPVKIGPVLASLDNAIEGSVGMEKKALQSARDMLMTTERRPVLDASGYPVYDAKGFQKFQDVPVSQNDANVLHKVKQELDNVIQYDAPGLGVPAGALTRQQGALKMARGQINAALEDQVPGYAAANAQSAALAKRADAVDAGTQYLGSGKTTPSPERFAADFEPLSQGEKIALAKGSRGNIERVLGTKANDLQALRGELQGEGGWNAAKMATVHGQDATDQLTGSVDRNLQFRDTYNKIVENSQTAQRTAAARAMKPEPSSELPLLGPSTTGFGFFGTLGKKIANAAYNGLRPDPTAAYGEIAKVLSAQGPQRDAYLTALADALKRREANAAMAPTVGNRGAFAAALAGDNYLQSRYAERSGNR